MHSNNIYVNYYYHHQIIIITGKWVLCAEIPARRKGLLPGTRLQVEHLNGHLFPFRISSELLGKSPFQLSHIGAGSRFGSVCGTHLSLEVAHYLGGTSITNESAINPTVLGSRSHLPTVCLPRLSRHLPILGQAPRGDSALGRRELGGGPEVLNFRISSLFLTNTHIIKPETCLHPSVTGADNSSPNYFIIFCHSTDQFVFTVLYMVLLLPLIVTSPAILRSLRGPEQVQSCFS